MNCEKGDIARIIGLPHSVSAANDRLVRVSELHVVDGVPYWRFEEPVKFRARSAFIFFGNTFSAGEKLALEGLNDVFLRPLRHPGDDAVDEMLLLARAPEAATA